jgi:hypothetical protein
MKRRREAEVAPDDEKADPTTGPRIKSQQQYAQWGKRQNSSNACSHGSRFSL